MWHVSVSLQHRRRRVVDPDYLERYALAALDGVGADTWERWTISDNGVGHLHVPVTRAEAARIPPGQVIGDAGEPGPERPRT